MTRDAQHRNGERALEFLSRGRVAFLFPVFGRLVVDVLAAVHATGVSAQPGAVRISDSSIAHATISNTGYWYTLDCDLGFGSDVGVYGASISYSTGS